jgi:hypothetical protein
MGVYDPLKTKKPSMQKYINIIFYVVTIGVLAVGLSQFACNPEPKPPTPPVM